MRAGVLGCRPVVHLTAESMSLPPTTSPPCDFASSVYAFADELDAWWTERPAIAEAASLGDD